MAGKGSQVPPTPGPPRPADAPSPLRQAERMLFALVLFAAAAGSPGSGSAPFSLSELLRALSLTCVSRRVAASLPLSARPPDGRQGWPGRPGLS